MKLATSRFVIALGFALALPILGLPVLGARGSDTWAPPNDGTPNPNTTAETAFVDPPAGAARLDPDDELDSGWVDVVLEVVRQTDPQTADEMQKSFDEKIVNFFRWADDGTPRPDGRSSVGRKSVGFKAKNSVSSQAAILVHEWHHIRAGHGHSGPIVSDAQQLDPCEHWMLQLESLEFLCALSEIDPESTTVDPSYLEIDCAYVQEIEDVGSIMLNQCYGADEFQFSLNAPCDMCEGS
jgi:hypothetical protein